MKFALFERLAGLVIWPRNRDPRIKGPHPRIVTTEQMRAVEQMRAMSGMAVEDKRRLAKDARN